MEVDIAGFAHMGFTVVGIAGLVGLGISFIIKIFKEVI